MKISLNELEVWRRVVFPADITFYGLHRVIQYSMGWFESHLYEFEVQSEKLVIVDSKEQAEELAFYNSQPAYDGRVKGCSVWRFQFKKYKSLDERVEVKACEEKLVYELN